MLSVPVLPLLIRNFLCPFGLTSIQWYNGYIHHVVVLGLGKEKKPKDMGHATKVMLRTS
ncbi:uncharacterized protein TrAFT101_004300 [Trichoderma asperellum]|uniref:uncharacterized protein n=1 Tax=Trichoderma asperellum TaxID=101201 RepID=UPI0033320604|nr:hypothetical protein TrAFT101_004300 [Trichoderma asperellum]